MKNLRKIKYIVIHSTAAFTKSNDETPFHYLIERNGSIVKLLKENKISSAVHADNSTCIHIAYIGSADKKGQLMDGRSSSQKHAMFDLIVSLTEKYPQAEVLGQSDFPDVKKASPGFDVKKWLREYEPDLGIAA